MTKIIRRNITGLILLDKPHGMSSNHALQKVKRLFHAEKAGHMGTLDPLASGLLPIALGQATKFSQYLLDAEKKYEVEAKLGERTSTQDAEGEVLEKHPVPKDLSLEKINELFNAFRGEITQIPSMFSALKHEGQALYKLARQGIEVPRKERLVKIFEIIISAYEAPMIYFSVRCSKGTYIRSLVDDFGKLIGCGAYVANLRRVGVDQFSIKNSLSLETLRANYNPEEVTALDHFLLSPEVMVSHLPKLIVSDEAIKKLRQGQFVPLPVILSAPAPIGASINKELVHPAPPSSRGSSAGSIFAQDERLCQLFNEAGEFFGVAEVDAKHQLLPRKLLFHDD